MEAIRLCRALTRDQRNTFVACFLGWALDAGYAGAFDLELLGPRIDQEGRTAACRRTADWLGDFLRARGA